MQFYITPNYAPFIRRLIQMLPSARHYYSLSLCVPTPEHCYHKHLRTTLKRLDSRNMVRDTYLRYFKSGRCILIHPPNFIRCSDGESKIFRIKITDNFAIWLLSDLSRFRDLEHR